MTHWAVVVWCLLLTLSPLGSALETVVARPPQGAVRGVSKTSLSGRNFWAFYNLPYAKPPVGHLRFKDPQPPDSWTHIRDATRIGPACAQVKIMRLQDPPIGAEDCLYLNVFTPELSGNLPVMVWIHGGGWYSDNAGMYRPDYILDHKVVLVNFNYRLGAFGFLSTEDAVAPGNFGFKDQVLALKWVKENIAAFGGDPNSVTIFGESAGGASVHYHMLSPLSRGLFHRAISQSGTAFSRWAREDFKAAERAKRAASVNGCPTTTSQELIDCLRKVDDYEIAKLSNILMEGFIPFRPVVEGDISGAFLPKRPLDLTPVQVPWISGITKNEGAVFAASFISNETRFAEFVENFEEILPNIFEYSSSPNKDMLTKHIRDFYFSSDGFTSEHLTDLLSDFLFNWGTDDAIRRYKNLAPTYYYIFAYRGANSIADGVYKEGPDLGVSHADDLFYFFPVEEFLDAPVEVPKEDFEVVHTITKLWTNFATTGYPTPGGDEVEWKKVTSDEELEYLEIGETLKMKKGPYKDRLNFWRSLPIEHLHYKDEL